MNKMTQSNKMGWDGLAETHFKNYHIDKLIDEIKRYSIMEEKYHY